MSQPSKQPPAFQAQSRPGLWARTPPAIFPAILGAFGVGQGWRLAGQRLGAPEWIGEMLLGALSLLFVFAAVAMLSKLARRPSVLLDDLKILPGRAGMSASTMTMMLFAVALVPVAPGLARAVLVLALIGHTIVALSVLRVLTTGPAVQRRVTPVWHLTFVGFIVAPLAAIPLGWVGLSQAIHAMTLPVAILIWVISARQFVQDDVPPPLRPLLAIHLAPVALFATVSGLLGYAVMGAVFAVLGLGLLALFLINGRWMTKAGFSALWGAFTFPKAAITNAVFVNAATLGHWSAVLAGVMLVAATLAVAAILFKIMQLWAKGALAVATNAATA
ncbi:tellurium resistance protein [Aliiroseovarius sp. PTFE2010]|uniref:SLAC1 family transporter n=1 Tax=Aliiroseovarius sp. PTFE2010 TaxID=3417190 RepID=UPI003CFBC0A4